MVIRLIQEFDAASVGKLLEGFQEVFVEHFALFQENA